MTHNENDRYYKKCCRDDNVNVLKSLQIEIFENKSIPLKMMSVARRKKTIPLYRQRRGDFSRNLQARPSVFDGTIFISSLIDTCIYTAVVSRRLKTRLDTCRLWAAAVYGVKGKRPEAVTEKKNNCYSRDNAYGSHTAWFDDIKCKR